MSGFAQGSLPDAQKESLCRDLLSEFGATNVKLRGDELQHGCLLPWANHKDQDRNPTASLNWDKLTYKCLGCGAGGGLLWFIAALRGCTSTEARRWLDKSTGLAGEVMDLHLLLNYFDDVYAERRKPPPIPTYAERILDPWMLIHPYMTEVRGCPEETLVRFKVGYAEDYRVSDTKVSERIVIPHFFKGDLVGWQSRRLWDDGTPKYLSTPEFPKDQTLYNYDPRNHRTAIVVESPLSVLHKTHVLGHVVGTFGASVTDLQVRLLTKYDRVILWMDNDDAGWNAVEGSWEINPKTNKARKISEGLGERLMPFIPVDVVDSPWAGDPCNVSDDEAVRLVENAVPFSIWSRPRELRQFTKEVSTAC